MRPMVDRERYEPSVFRSIKLSTMSFLRQRETRRPDGSVGPSRCAVEHNASFTFLTFVLSDAESHNRIRSVGKPDAVI